MSETFAVTGFQPSALFSVHLLPKRRSHLFGLIHARNQWDILAKAAAKSRSFSDDDMLKHIDIHKTDFLKAPPWGHVIIFHLVLDLAVLVALAVIHRASC